MKRSVSIRGHRTSFSIEEPFFSELCELAALRGMPVAKLVEEVDSSRPDGVNLSSALRLHVLDAVKRR